MNFIKLVALLAGINILSGCMATTQNDMVSLTDKTWVAEDIMGRGVMDILQSSISIDSAGDVKGFGGCNNFFGKAELNGPNITFGLMGSTRMLCAEAVSNQESEFHKALPLVKSYKIENGILHFTNDTGDTILRFWQREVAMPEAIVSGTAIYLARIALPENAHLVVQILDVSRADAPSVVISETVISPAGQVPIRFEIPYDENKIDERFSYSVSAKIMVGDKVKFRTTSHYGVITRGNDHQVDLVLDMMP